MMHPDGNSVATSRQSAGSQVTGRRQVRPAVRQARHPERTPVTLTCKKCGHQWESYGSEGSTIKCPQCRTGQRLHRDAAARHDAVASPQVTGTVLSTRMPVTAAFLPDADPMPGAVRQLPRVLAVPDDIDEYEPDEQDELLGVLADDADDAELSPVPADSDSALERLLDAAAAASAMADAGRPQQFTGDPGIVKRVTEALLIYRQAEDLHIHWRVYPAAGGMQRLVIYPDSEDEVQPMPVIVPQVQRAVEKARPVITQAVSVIQATFRPDRRSAKRSCDFCSRKPGFSCRNLYTVSGGALGRARTLCEHCTGRETAAGANAVPLNFGVQRGAGITVL